MQTVFPLKQIASPQNPFIKNIALLVHKASERKAQGLFVAEGLRELELALRSGYEATALLFDEALTPLKMVQDLAATAKIPPAEIISVTAPVMEKIAYRSSVANVVGLFKVKNFRLDDLSYRAAPFLLVVERVEKPGNLGAILRTADAAGLDALLCCDPLTDVFNPNIIRASLGAVFTVPVVAVSSEEAAEWLKKQGISILATWLEAAKPLYECDLRRPLAIVLGAEATGISEFWIRQADERIIVPMFGQVDSLNVSATAAVALFETVRQRLKVDEG